MKRHDIEDKIFVSTYTLLSKLVERVMRLEDEVKKLKGVRK